jgi:hypothetical protein
MRYVPGKTEADREKYPDVSQRFEICILNLQNALQEVGGGRGDWMELAQDRDRWRALVGTVRDFRVP